MCGGNAVCPDAAPEPLCVLSGSRSLFIRTPEGLALNHLLHSCLPLGHHNGVGATLKRPSCFHLIPPDGRHSSSLAIHPPQHTFFLLCNSTPPVQTASPEVPRELGSTNFRLYQWRGLTTPPLYPTD